MSSHRLDVQNVESGGLRIMPIILIIANNNNNQSKSITSLFSISPSHKICVKKQA